MSGAWMHARRRMWAMRSAWPLIVGVGVWLSVVTVLRLGPTLQLFLGPLLQVAAALVLVQASRGHGALMGEGWPMPGLPLSGRGRVAAEVAAALGGLLMVLASSTLGLMALLQVGEWPEGVEVVVRWGAGVVPLVLAGSVVAWRATMREGLVWMAGLAAAQGLALGLGGWSGEGAAVVVAAAATAVVAVAATAGWVSLRLPGLAPSSSGVGWSTGVDPRVRLRQALWSGLGGDVLRAGGVGLGVALFFGVARLLAGDPSRLVGGLGLVAVDGVVIALTVTAVVAPWWRRSLPGRVVSQGPGREAGFLAAYQVLPLPGWMILRRMVWHSAVVFGGLIALAMAVVVLAKAWGGVWPSLVFLPAGALYAAPITWAMRVAEGQERSGLLAAIGTLGLVGAGLLMTSVPELLLRPELPELLMAAGGLGCGVVASSLPVRALWPGARAVAG